MFRLLADKFSNQKFEEILDLLIISKHISNEMEKKIQNKKRKIQCIFAALESSVFDMDMVYNEFGHIIKLCGSEFGNGKKISFSISLLEKNHINEIYGSNILRLFGRSIEQETADPGLIMLPYKESVSFKTIASGNHFLMKSIKIKNMNIDLWDQTKLKDPTDSQCLFIPLLDYTGKTFGLITLDTMISAPKKTSPISSNYDKKITSLNKVKSSNHIIQNLEGMQIEDESKKVFIKWKYDINNLDNKNMRIKVNFIKESILSNMSNDANRVNLNSSKNASNSTSKRINKNQNDFIKKRESILSEFENDNQYTEIQTEVSFNSISMFKKNENDVNFNINQNDNHAENKAVPRSELNLVKNANQHVKNPNKADLNNKSISLDNAEILNNGVIEEEKRHYNRPKINFVPEEIQFYLGLTKAISIVMHKSCYRLHMLNVYEKFIYWAEKRCRELTETKIYFVEHDINLRDIVLVELINKKVNRSILFHKVPIKLYRIENLFRKFLFECADFKQVIFKECMGDNQLIVPLSNDSYKTLFLLHFNFSSMKLSSNHKIEDLLYLLKVLEIFSNQIAKEMAIGTYRTQHSIIQCRIKINEIKFDWIQLLILRIGLKTKVNKLFWNNLSLMAESSTNMVSFFRAVLMLIRPDLIRDDILSKWSTLKPYLNSNLNRRIEVFDPLDKKNFYIELNTIKMIISELNRDQIAISNASIPMLHLFDWLNVVISLMDEAKIYIKPSLMNGI